MDDVAQVEVLDCLGRLVEELEGFGLAETHFQILVVEQISIRGIFHDHVHLAVVQQGVPQLHDMRVVELAVNLYLPLHDLELCLVRQRFDVHLHPRIATILMAYTRLVPLCSANLTTPKDPVPTSRF